MTGSVDGCSSRHSERTIGRTHLRLRSGIGQNGNDKYTKYLQYAIIYLMYPTTVLYNDLYFTVLPVQYIIWRRPASQKKRTTTTGETKRLKHATAFSAQLRVQRTFS